MRALGSLPWTNKAPLMIPVCESGTLMSAFQFPDPPRRPGDIANNLPRDKNGLDLKAVSGVVRRGECAQRIETCHVCVEIPDKIHGPDLVVHYAAVIEIPI